MKKATRTSLSREIFCRISQMSLMIPNLGTARYLGYAYSMYESIQMLRKA